MRGHEITLMASSPSSFVQFEESDTDGVKLVKSPRLKWLHSLNGYDIYETARRVRWVEGRRFDIVHAFESRPSTLYPALAAQKNGAKLVMDWCDWFGKGGSVELRSNPFLRMFLRPIETFYEESFRRRSEGTTVISSVLRRRAQSLGIRPESIIDLPNGADTRRIYPLDLRQARATLKLPTEAPILGYMGAIFAEDANLLLDAFRRIQKSKPDALLIMIGDPKTKISAGEGIIQTGFVSEKDLIQYLAACDVLCLPLSDSIANRGRLPSKIVDYFAAGRATVVCNVGDVADIVRSAQAGLVSQPTAKDFSDRILDLLADSELRQQLGTNARKAAETDFNWDTIACQVEEFYLKLTANAVTSSHI